MPSPLSMIILNSSMDDLKVAEEIARQLREEPYHLLHSNCFLKGIRFCRECQRRGIKSKLVFCILGVGKNSFPAVGEITRPSVIHFWGEVEGQRLEISRPIGNRGFLGIVPAEMKPLLTIKMTFRPHKR